MFKGWKKSHKLAIIALIFITVIWGWSFIIVKQAVARMPVMDFLALRFAVAAIVMIVIRPRSIRSLNKPVMSHGLILGIFLGASYITQTYALVYSTATVVGFITGLSIILTPFFAWLWMKQKITGNVWIAVVLSFAGLALISYNGLGIGTGELLTIVCAFTLALYVVGLGKWSPQHDSYNLTTVQMLTMAVILLLFTVPTGLVIPTDPQVWFVIIVTGVVATSLAFFIQTWAQSLITPTHTAVILTLEPLFAGMFGVLIGNEPLTVKIVLGAALMLAAMYLVQLKSSKVYKKLPS
ncbi:MAG: DMT family transporter [Dehalococcoidales bacterium]